jgi:dTDP-4-amino-4,6-dideoxygalactose transaminase
MINVTKVHLPPLEEYVKHLEGIWARGHLTNNGPLVIELERGLREYLGVPYVFLVSNGMLALHIAFKALQLKGKVVTTPFSYVATTASLAWEGLQPIFADLDERLCIGATAIESVWSEDVCAILATHVYGNACDVESIEALAKRKKVPVIYDAAHSFGARYQGRSLVSHGDIATLSFHATKLFHTGEGGAVITHDPALAKRIEYLRNFGHASPEMGLCILPKVDQLIAARKALVEKYDSELKGMGLTQPMYPTGLERNYAYYPVLFKSEADLLTVRSVLNTENIYPRRYFYPSLSSLNYVLPQATPICDDIARRVLCLPLWPELDPMQVTRISALIRRALS